ncbi:hypothetical protein [uncultured Planktosalinus sp.]|uniref:hypothetical protein n=1 Tax=uncultured Planktosalinus sp. TaxID=1810935 RepID=UPI0030DAF267
MIQKHHDEIDIQMLFFKQDLDRWFEEAEFIQFEIRFFNGIFISDLISKLQTDFYSTQEHNANLLDFELKHRALIKELNHLNYKTEGIKECDDLQCENYYLNDINKFKTKIELHFSNYRDLKKELMTYLNSGLQKFI